MPTDRVRIASIHSVPTRKPGVTSHTIYFSESPKGLGAVQTVSDWLASLCLAALKANRWIDLTWKDAPQPFGKTAVMAELVTDEDAA
jgi:hypothetical protein